MALPVVENGRPVGLIDRQEFLLKLASPLGHSRYASRPVSWIMDSDPSVIEADTRISSFSEIILKSSASTLMRGFIVTKDSLYFGTGTAIKLFHHVNMIQAARLKEQEHYIAALQAQQVDQSAVSSARNSFVETLTQALSAPLSTVDAFSKIVSRQPLPVETRSHLDAIVQASGESLDMLQKARDLARAEAGEFPLNLSPMPPRLVMEQINTDWIQRADDAGVTLMVSYEGDPDLSLLVDEARFRTTYDTLIQCALKWARNGMVEVGLKAIVSDDRVDLQARVRDDGPGLEPDQLATCFGDLATTGDLSSAMAWHLLRNMGGEIFARNNQGRGTTYGFDVTVQRALPDVSQEINVTQIESLELSSHPHVLIADDNATNRVVARALCEMFGCTSETAEDGQEAVDAARTGHFDLILMDIKMPRMDGVQATRTIRDFADDRALTPIIALTANADPDDVVGYIAAGMACVVEKPIKPERLRMAMIRALDERQSLPAADKVTRLSAQN
ncbi:MAG: response regulator [Brevundimonas sp.]